MHIEYRFFNVGDMVDLEVCDFNFGAPTYRYDEVQREKLL